MNLLGAFQRAVTNHHSGNVAEAQRMCEAILAKLHFAVAPVDSIDKAVSIIGTLRPDVIVVHARDTAALQRAAWPTGVPFVNVTEELRDQLDVPLMDASFVAEAALQVLNDEETGRAWVIQPNRVVPFEFRGVPGPR